MPPKKQQASSSSKVKEDKVFEYYTRTTMSLNGLDAMYWCGRSRSSLSDERMLSLRVALPDAFSIIPLSLKKVRT